MIENYFIFDIDIIASKKRRFGISHLPTKEHRKKIEKLLRSYEFNVDECIDNFLLLFDLFVLTAKEWDIYNRTSLTKDRQTIKDHKEFLKLYDNIRDGDSIKTIEIKTTNKKTIKFSSPVFQAHAGNWLYSLRRFIPNQSLDWYKQKSTDTKPISRNTYLISHDYTFAFMHYLKDNYPQLKAHNKFIQLFFDIVFIKGPTAKKLSEGLNKQSKLYTFRPGGSWPGRYPKSH